MNELNSRITVQIKIKTPINRPPTGRLLLIGAYKLIIEILLPLMRNQDDGRAITLAKSSFLLKQNSQFLIHKYTSPWQYSVHSIDTGNFLQPVKC